jgi:hypothetical protein
VVSLLIFLAFLSSCLLQFRINNRNLSEGDPDLLDNTGDILNTRTVLPQYP